MWATQYIKQLQEGEVVQFRPKGHSMTGKVNHNQLVTVAPIDDDEALTKGSIVLCKVRGNQYLHLIKAVRGEQYQIGNNKGHINGWVSRSAIYGKLTKVE